MCALVLVDFGHYQYMLEKYWLLPKEQEHLKNGKAHTPVPMRKTILEIYLFGC